MKNNPTIAICLLRTFNSLKLFSFVMLTLHSTKLTKKLTKNYKTNLLNYMYSLNYKYSIKLTKKYKMKKKL